MSSFEATIDAQLRGLTVRYADMVRFLFKSGEIRLHQGTGKIVDGNGEVWQGIGALGQAGPVQSGSGGGADEVTFTLATTPEALAHFEDDVEESAGQLVIRYLQFFDVRQRDGAGNWVEWQPLDQPVEIFRGRLGPLQIDRPPVTDAGAGVSRIITVKAINAFANRRRPPYGFFSHRDQLARTNNTDNIFVNTSRMAESKVRWPSGLT